MWRWCYQDYDYDVKCLKLPPDFALERITRPRVTPFANQPKVQIGRGVLDLHAKMITFQKEGFLRNEGPWPRHDLLGPEVGPLTGFSTDVPRPIYTSSDMSMFSLSALFGGVDDDGLCLGLLASFSFSEACMYSTSSGSQWGFRPPCLCVDGYVMVVDPSLVIFSLRAAI